MRKVFILLLCMMALIAFASCTNTPSNNEPAPDPTPAPSPEPTPEPEPAPAAPTEEEHQAVLAGDAYYRLTATRAAKRFALQYLDDEDGTFDPEPGDVLTLKYRTNFAVDRFYLRDSSEKTYLTTEPDNKYHAIAAENDPYVSAADEDGWITITFEFVEMTDPHFGFRIELANYSGVKFTAGDYIDIKDLEFKGEKLAIDIAGAEDDYQCDHGVWNATNTDHTLPTLEVKYFESVNNE